MNEIPQFIIDIENETENLISKSKSNTFTWGIIGFVGQLLGLFLGSVPIIFSGFIIVLIYFFRSINLDLKIRENVSKLEGINLYNEYLVKGFKEEMKEKTKSIW